VACGFVARNPTSRARGGYLAERFRSTGVYPSVGDTGLSGRKMRRVPRLNGPADIDAEVSAVR
jgi:hypothetical protein